MAIERFECRKGPETDCLTIVAKRPQAAVDKVGASFGIRHARVYSLKNPLASVAEAKEGDSDLARLEAILPANSAD